MAKPKMIGIVNGRVQSNAMIGRKSFVFDGTTKGLTISALGNGAKAGDIIKANFGGGFRKMILESTPWDGRANGYWCSDVRQPTRD